MKKITLLFALMLAMVTTAMAQDAAEPITATISPSAPVSTIWGDGDLTIAFNKAVDYTAPEDGIQIVDADKNAVSNVSSLILNTAKTGGFIMLDASISQEGTYTITFPAGAFTSEDGAVSEEMTFQLTIETVIPEPTWWTDYDYTAVTKEISKITIGFDNLTELKLNDANAAWLFTSANDEYEGTAEIVETVDEKEGKKSTNIVITFGETFTNEGTYYLNIPAGMFTMNGSFDNEEKNLELRILAPVEVTPLAIESITPKFGENGEFLEVWIAYNQRVYFGNQDWMNYVVNLTDADGNQYPMWPKDIYDPITWAQVIPSNTVVLMPVKLNEEGYPYEMNEYNQYAASPMTTQGEYTLNLADVTVRYGYDAVAYAYNAIGSYNGTEVITIGNDTAVEGIEAEAENAEIFDLTGRKVEKITKAGIYIVNGVKRIVK